jgi:hypothetical protein
MEQKICIYCGGIVIYYTNGKKSLDESGLCDCCRNLIQIKERQFFKDLELKVEDNKKIKFK